MVAVGIDISKESHELCLMSSEATSKPLRHKVLNNAQGYADALRWARAAAGSQELVFCMESTGGYEFDFACYLAKMKLRVCVENPRWIKHFALAKGATNKTDSADARAIASYALAMAPKEWALSDETRREIAMLARHRESVLEELTRARNRLERKQQLPDLVAQQLEAQVELFSSQIQEVTDRIARLAKESAEFKRELDALMRLPGIGEVIAFTVLSEMPDVGLFECAETWAACAGLYPRRCESGKFKGMSFMCRLGNAHVRRALYMGVTQAKRLHPGIKGLAERLAAKGKKPKQIRVACMRKMLLIAYGILKAIRNGVQPFYQERPNYALTT